jgi:hypothetical protein
MMNWVATVNIVLQLLPALIQAIKAIEDAIPGEGQGEKKLAAIRGIMEATSAQAATVWPAIEKTIGVLVGLFNTTGAFRK